ncbi:MAG: hypothetical protein RSD07_02260 [Angelakisella sp.]
MERAPITTIMLLIIIALLVGGVFLQIFLSKKKNKWFGLILPAITFFYSMLMVLSIAALNGMTGGEIFMLFASTLLISNIPTIILLGIYFSCREKMKIRCQIDKMNIQDLD